MRGGSERGGWLRGYDLARLLALTLLLGSLGVVGQRVPPTGAHRAAPPGADRASQQAEGPVGERKAAGPLVARALAIPRAVSEAVTWGRPGVWALRTMAAFVFGGCALPARSVEGSVRSPRHRPKVVEEGD